MRAAAATCSSSRRAPGAAISRPYQNDIWPSRGSSWLRRDGTRSQIPVSVAFFFFNSSLGRVAAFYPGPAGATESELPLERWAEVVAANPEVGTLQPDVEAFLVRAHPDREAECYLVPIDACYELVGRLRQLWRGFDGGQEAHEQLELFFDRVRARCGSGPS